MSKPIVKLYYYEETGNGDIMDWSITSDYNIASKGFNFRTCTLKDLELNGFEPLSFLDNKVLQVDDGFFEWNHKYGEWSCVDDIKEVLLDWLEYIDLENEIIYEVIVGWRNWKVHSFLDR